MITSSKISFGDQLGAQLTKLAQLKYIAEETGQPLVLWGELRYFKRGYQFLDVFELPEYITVTYRSGKVKRRIIQRYCHRYQKGIRGNWEKSMRRIYSSRLYRLLDRMIYEWIRLDYKDYITIKNAKDGKHTDKKLLDIERTTNYDILNGFGTYQDWKKYEDLIKSNLKYKKSIQKKGDSIYTSLNKKKRKVSVHLRRTDYLLLSSLNLDDEYYEKALKLFDNTESQFVVLSDDIESCKKMTFFKGRDVVFIESNSAAVDMYLMSKCDDNIIANSTFSFWGAFLNYNPEKKVVCPRDFIGRSATEVQYINGNYYPDDWIAL